MPRMTLGSVYQKTKDAFAKTGIAQPALDARLLICHALHMTHEAFIMRGTNQITATQQTAIAVLIDQRLAGRPVAKIMGRKEFYGRDFITTDDTLDPRPDSETLIEAVLRHRPVTENPRILDLGTGTGCLLLTLLAELPDATGVAVDQSVAALAVAQRNAHLLGLGDRVAFATSDWFGAVMGSFDIIISNPPYIPAGDIAGLAPDVRLFDPMAALVGGADGLDPYRVIIPQLHRYLKPGGIAAFELGRGQDGTVADMLRANGFTDVLTFADLAGVARVVMGINLQTPA